MAYWVCSIFKTPIFNPKFSLQSISFSQITEISAPEHSPFQSFWQYGIPQLLIDTKPTLAKQKPRKVYMYKKANLKELKANVQGISDDFKKTDLS